MINGQDDIILQPVDTALEHRLEEDIQQDQYKMPFISFWQQEPYVLDDKRYNHAFSTTGARIDLGGDVVEVDLYRAKIQFEVNFWHQQNKREVDRFNLEWITGQRNKTTHTMSFPFLDTNRQETGDELTFEQYVQLDDLTDNSAIERQYSEGVHFRYTGTLSLSTFIFEPERPNTLPLIDKILVDYFIKEEGGDVLVDEVTV